MSLFTGVGFEYEFDAKAKGTTYEFFNINAPKLEGTTAIGTLGINKPTSSDRLSVDIKANGFLGMREGISGLFNLKYKF